MYIIFRLILSFVHFVYNFYYFIQRQYTRIALLVERCRYTNKPNCSYLLLKSNEQLINVPKIPRHLAMLLGHEEVSVIDLVKLISWCIMAEIPCVSFYDHKGNLRENQIVIAKKLNELEPNLAKRIEWSNFSNGSVNGVKRIDEIKANNIHKHKTRIYFLSFTDCKGKIISLTKSLVRLSDSNTFREENITPEFLDEKLNISNGTPDPNLAIVFGKTMCTYGFLPWQSRITEFFMLPTHHDISSDSFVKTLMKFSECQQRYGK